MKKYTYDIDQENRRAYSQQSSVKASYKQLEETMKIEDITFRKALLLMSFLMAFFFCSSVVFAADYTLTVTHVDALDEGGQLSFTVELNPALQAEDTDVHVDYTVSAGDAEAADYSSVGGDSGTITFNGAITTETIVVNTTDDAFVETDETVLFTLSGQGYGAGSTGGSITVPDLPDTAIIPDNDKTDLSINPGSGFEDSGAISFTVDSTLTVESPATVTATVSPSTVGADTAAPSDYSGASKTVVITGGNSTVISIAPVTDGIVEGDETFTVTLSGGSANVNAIAGPTAQGSIQNDDTATLTITDVSVAEDIIGGIAQFTVSSDAVIESSAGVTIDWSASQEAADTATTGLDFGAVSGNNVAISDTDFLNLDIPINNEGNVEGDETYSVTLSDVQGPAQFPSGAVNLIVQGIITNDDDASFNIISDVSVSEDVLSAIATFTVSTPDTIEDSAGTILVTYDAHTDFGQTATAGSDYLASGSLTFSSASASETFDVTITDDPVVESDETYTVGIAVASGSAEIGPNATRIGTIVNDDQPTLNIDSLIVTEGDAGTSIATFTVRSTLQVADNADVTFDYTIVPLSAEWADFTGVVSGSGISITNGDSTQIDIEIVGDLVVEIDETFRVDLSNPDTLDTAVDPLGVGLAGPSEIHNNDSYTISIEPDKSAFEGDGSMVFQIELSNPVEWDVVVPYTFNDTGGDTAVGGGTDYIDPGTSPLTFVGNPDGSGDVTQSITVALTDDNVSETPDEFFTITLGDPVDPTSFSFAQKVGKGTIQNDDHTFVITNTDAAAGTLTTLYGGGHTADDTFTVTEGSDITFDMDSTDLCYHIADFQVDGTSLGDLSSYTNQPPNDYNDYINDSYTISAVDAPHTVNLDFALNTYTIHTINYGGNGTISPENQEVDCNGASTEVTVTPAEGYYVTWIAVDGVREAGVYGLTSTDPLWAHDFGNITADHTVEVAFSVKATLLYDSPFGEETIYVYNSDVDGPVADGTMLTPDEGHSVVVDYGAELRFETAGESHTVQGPDYIASPETFDDRAHVHHLSQITDNSNVGSALCYDGSNYTSSDYRSNANCLYTVASMTENHELQILYTRFIDVSAHGLGDINITPVIAGWPVQGTDGGFDVGTFELEAGEEKTLSFAPGDGWFVQSLKYKETTDATPAATNDPGMTSISRAASFVTPPTLDVEHGLQVNFSINKFTISASSTFEELLFYDSALTDKISVENDNTEFQALYDADKSYYVLINDPDFSVVGVSLDNNFIPLETIRDYADGTSTNPNDTIYSFSITTVSGNEILTITFNNIKVSHNLEVRDYDKVIISDLPLDAQANPNPPSLMFVTDDSGSMDWEFMVEGGSGGTYHGYYYIWSQNTVPDSVIAYPWASRLQDNGRHDEWKTQWSGFNKMYYNPAVIYSPWPDFKGTIDHDNDPSTPEIGSSLPATDVTGDNLAHANIYRPRHHGWLNVSCDAALLMAVNRRAGTVPTPVELQNMRTTCDASAGNTNWEQTFDMDGVFLSYSIESEIIVDNSDAAFSSSATGWAPYNSSGATNGQYIYADNSNTPTRTAQWTFTPDQTTQWKVYAKWLSNSNREIISYDLECPTCAAPVNDQIMQDQNDGQSTATWRFLDEYTLDNGEAFTVTLTDTHNHSSSSAADAVKIVRTTGADIINAHYITFDDQNSNKERDAGESFWVVNLADPIQYIEILDAESPSATTPELSATNLGSVYTGSTLPAGLNLITYASPTDVNAFVLERQNFADWFSYYRTRQLAATSAIARSIEKMSNVNVGIHTINYSSWYGISQSALPVNVWGKRDKTKYLYYLLYSFEQGAYGTPLRSGFSEVAEYFDATDGLDGGVRDTMGQSGLTRAAYTCGSMDGGDNDDFLSPFARDVSDNCNEKNGDRCKVGIAVLVTDGYWNSDGSVGGEVASDFVLPEHPSELKPIWINTLAETAYDYRFNKDLMNDSEGDQQFLITYGVAFGLDGSLPYTDDLQCTVSDVSDCPVWPKPASNSPTTIDDLWHASVVGDGKYLNADNPDSLVKALGSIVTDIEGKQGSSASLAVNGDELYETIGTEIRMYQASWNTDDWSGDLRSYAPLDCFDADGNFDIAIAGCLKWSAKDTLASRTDSRIIASFNPWTGAGIGFQYNQLDALQKSRLFPYFAHDLDDPGNPTDEPAEQIVNFLRGDVVLHDDVRRKLRALPQRPFLGDIVNSQGRFQRYEIDDSDGNSPGDADWEPTYEGVIFIGANDGMLHAFSAQDADNGKELFAYVPSMVYRNLRELANPEYKDVKHKMFVDATPYTQTIKLANGNKKTILIGGLGKGGRGYFALDITDANLAITEAQLKDRVLWEYPPPADKIAENRTVTFTANRIEFATSLTPAEITILNKYKFIEIVGGNIASGALVSSNDGIYEIDAVAADGSYIQIPSSNFSVAANVNVTILGSISDPDMGYSFSKPIIVESRDPLVGQNGWVVLFGNGYGSENGDSVLYILDPITGEEIEKPIGTAIGKIYTVKQGENGAGFNGMTTPKAIDVDNDLKVDYVYGGDLLGNMWKFDLNNPSAEKWQVAFCEGSNNDDQNDCTRSNANVIPKPLFSTKLKQSVTSAPDVMRHETGLGYVVIFGSGKYLGWLDIYSTDTQSLYGIWDWAPDTYDEGYHGARADNENTSVDPPVTYVELTHYDKKDALGAPLRSLLKQEVILEGTINVGDDTDGDGEFDTYQDVSYYRVPTSYKGDWRVATNSSLGTGSLSDYPKLNGPDNMSVPLANLGWVFDLPGKLKSGNSTGPLDHTADNYDLGERQVNDTIIRNGKAIMITFGLNSDKCGTSDVYSFINERNASTGGMLFNPNFDLNGDGHINDEDVVTLIDENGDSYTVIPTDKSFDGRLFNPVILQNDDGRDPPVETKYFSGSILNSTVQSSAKIETLEEAAEIRGVYYWKQVQ